MTEVFEGKRTDYSKAALVFGVSMSVVFSISWIVAVVIDGTWVFGKNMVSNLGVSVTDAHYVFGWGSIISGILGSLCALSLYKGHDGKAGKAAFLMFFVAGPMLVIVGVFNEHTAPHTPAAIALFVLTWLAMLVLGVRDMRIGNGIEGAVNLGMTTFVVFALMLNPLPTAEALVIIALLIWVPFIAHSAYRGQPGYL